MSKIQQYSLTVLRVVLGWMFFYAGITKVLNPEWSAEGYLKGAKLFTGFYAWLASPAMLPFTNFMNEWGLTLLGVALITGVGVKCASKLGIALMVLYYLPILDGFYPNAHAFIVDEHIIYIAGLWVLMAFKAGSIYTLASKLPRLPKWLS